MMMLENQVKELKRENDKLRLELDIIRAANSNMRKDTEAEVEIYRGKIRQLEEERNEGEQIVQRETQGMGDALKEARGRAETAENLLREAREELRRKDEDYNQKMRELEVEIKAIREKEQQLEEINAKAAKRTQSLSDELDAPYVNNIINEILNEGKNHLDSIKALRVELLSTKEKFGCLNNLFKILSEGKASAEEKYNKLLDLHNQLIELNSKSEEVFNPNRVSELSDENAGLRKQLNALHKSYEYFCYI